MTRRRLTMIAGVGLTAILLAGLALVTARIAKPPTNQVVAHFANSNGIFVGDEVRILGVPVGRIDSIEPLPQEAKITFSVDSKYKVPANVNAVILSPSLVTARAIQLTPAYTSGPVMGDDAVIPLKRTAVPVEWDDLRDQLERLTDTLQPTEPGGVSTLGAFIDVAADNLRGQGPNIRQTVIDMSKVFSALGDHSNDVFGTVKNLSILVSALSTSTDVMRNLNLNLAATTALLANDPNEISNVVNDLAKTAAEVKDFVADNQESLGTTVDKLQSVSTAVIEKTDDLKQSLHIMPNTLSNLSNIYQPAQGALTGALALNNFANPLGFLCGAIQAASKMNAEQSAKLCVQYLAPILKNRSYNFLPVGINPFVGAAARPNERTFSEDRLRPDYVAPAPAPAPDAEPAVPGGGAPLSAEAHMPSVPTDPAAGLPGMMVPAGAGS